MSTPQFIDLPPGVRRTDLSLGYGPVAALRASPTSSSTPEKLAPAVLVHGFTGSKEDFIALLYSLAHAGREVIAIDLPGTYQSPGPETLTPHPDVPLPDYTAASFGEVVAEVCGLVGAGGPVHLLGHSFGGLVVRETALSGISDLASLTLMCSGPAALAGQSATNIRAVVAALSKDPTPERLRELWDGYLGAESAQRAASPEVLDFLRDRLLHSSAVGLMRVAQELLDAEDRVTELVEVEVPKLVLYGEADDAWPPQVQDTLAERLGAQRLVVPGAGHSPNVEAPEATSTALTTFWDSTEQAGHRTRIRPRSRSFGSRRPR